MKKWRVTIMTYEYSTADIEAETKEEAERIVQAEINKNDGFVENCCDSYENGAYVVSEKTELQQEDTLSTSVQDGSQKITFKSINDEGETKKWEFSSLEEIGKLCENPDSRLPASNDLILDVEQNGAKIYGQAPFSKMLQMLGIKTKRKGERQ